MAIQTTELTRAFIYNNIPLPDPGPQFNVNQVRDLWAGTYPEIVNAAIEGPVEKDGKMLYTFRRAVGTKGYEWRPRPGARKGFPKVVAGVEVKRCSGCTVDK